ncbi:hypothetical protein FYM98_05415 [Lactobacillus salivarius]|uniref:hypothetical protein n=2 Tax=Ligilactobacillus salivarius TaxID=1624 RepID=UPI0013691631|nr:hypothetical protein [Ligilactobacillus salivarius]MYU58485.1 hypothetical protein [Ligilactobacillus salivarius]MYV03887.1 hypothetical protein [Ligilactobacillus salivarius]MYY56304.1 hypothetical protein [Ligilactobacillus salivarius]
MELNYIIDGLIDGIKDIRKHNHEYRQNSIYDDLDKQSELINKLIEFKKQQESDEYNMKIARQLTDIAENIQALVKLMALVSISNSDDAKAYFMNETLTHVLDSLCNSIDDITNLSDSLVDLD